jgi:dipeptidyl aminopeptidase/acylaminoacyl peptidase
MASAHLKYSCVLSIADSQRISEKESAMNARARLVVFLLLLAVPAVPALAQAPTASASGPSIDDLISMKRAGAPSMSPDGKWVAYTVRETNWDDNSYETEIWLADATTRSSRQLTNAAKSSNTPSWSRDSGRLAFLSDRAGKRQIYVIDPRGGEAQKITASDEGVNAIAWSPDGKSIAYTQNDGQSEASKAREKKYGEFEIVDADYRMSHLNVVDLGTGQSRQLTKGAFTVGRFDWSPDGSQIAFDHRVNTDPASGGTADISIVAVGSGVVRPLVTQQGPDANPVWSPDGAEIAFESAMANASFFYTNTHVAKVRAAGGPIEDLSAAFDEDAFLVRWTGAGIFFSASSQTWSYLFSLDPATKKTTRHRPSEKWIGTNYSLTADGRTAAFIASDAATFPEVYFAPVSTMQPVRLSDLGAQTSSWTRAPIDVISWSSKDGATVEGVLHKPVGFTAGRRYPLLVVIHGGPTAVSRPIPYSSASIYPIDLWVAKGALVLEPNYRGSAGYGEKFRSLNVRNLGVGDSWDVIAGIDFLIKEGMADPDRVGAMGWSQGGYISAFLTTHDSARFKAVSVGAGISDWMTYYVNTDIHPFTRQYLKATPWDDPDIYAKTSPITYIKGAKAPTLIQHGATDQRVPLPNAFELYQGLQDVGVPTKLIVYRGFEGIGHGPSKPKSSRAVMEHNLEWFDTHIWGGTAAPTGATGNR